MRVTPVKSYISNRNFSVVAIVVTDEAVILTLFVLFNTFVALDQLREVLELGIVVFAVH